MSTINIGAVLPDIHLLTIVAQTGSFTGAARRLGISKASVSMRVAALERRVGVPLVRRSTRSLRLTEAGAHLLEAAQPAFASIEDSLSAVRDLSDEPRGTVRLTAPVALGRQYIAPLLTGFMKRYPEIHVHLELTDRFVNLTSEGFDLAIRHVSEPPENHVAWPLCDTQSVLVASPAYLRRHGTPRHPVELSGHSCLLYPDRAGSATWSFVAADGGDEPTVVPVRGRFQANNSEVLREMALAGLGIALLPDFSAVPGTGRKLTELLPDWRVQGNFGVRIHALRPWSARVPRAVQVMVECLRTGMASGYGRKEAIK